MNAFEFFTGTIKIYQVLLYQDSLAILPTMWIAIFYTWTIFWFDLVTIRRLKLSEKRQSFNSSHFYVNLLLGVLLLHIDCSCLVIMQVIPGGVYRDIIFLPFIQQALFYEWQYSNKPIFDNLISIWGWRVKTALPVPSNINGKIVIPKTTFGFKFKTPNRSILFPSQFYVNWFPGPL